MYGKKSVTIQMQNNQPWDRYVLFRGHHDQFMEEASLREFHHPLDINHIEAFNKLITKFLPKDWTYCKLIEKKVRIHLTMYIQPKCGIQTLLLAPVLMYRNLCQHGVWATVSPKWKPDESLEKALPKEAGGKKFPNWKTLPENQGSNKGTRGGYVLC
jgi:hypothetical protein